MPIIPLITVAEADSFNSLSSDWLLIPTAEKDAHIINASLYMQGNWSCTDVDWTDPTTLDDDLKRACAYYADADRLKLLYAEVSFKEPHKAIIEETKKLDGLLKTIKWADSGATVTGNPLGSIHAIMKLYCINIGSTTLVRV